MEVGTLSVIFPSDSVGMSAVLAMCPVDPDDCGELLHLRGPGSIEYI